MSGQHGARGAARKRRGRARVRSGASASCSSCKREGFDARLHRAARALRRGRHGAGRARVARHSLHRQRRDGARRSRMDKLRTKLVWVAGGLPTPRYEVLDATTATGRRSRRELGLPLIVKPAREGSTLGLTKVTSVEKICRPRTTLARAATTTLVHRRGVHRRARAHRRRSRRRGAAAHPHRGAAGQLRLPEQVLQRRHASTSARAACRRRRSSAIQALALRGVPALGCSGWGRVDLMLDAPTAAVRCSR